MAIINWSDSLSVYVETIDNQHKKLITILNKLHDAMRNGEGNKALKEILEELICYTVYHFSTEEKYFEQFKYDNTAAHKEEHKAFVTKVNQFKKEFDSGNITLTIDVMNFLKQWVNTHITLSDKKYSQCFKANGLV